MEETEMELKAYPLNDGFICSLQVDKSFAKASRNAFKVLNLPKTVIILDRSGSMGNSVERIVNKVLPIFFEKLSYEPDNRIHLITFDSTCEVFSFKVEALRQMNMTCRGCTKMSLAVEEFTSMFEKFDKSKPLRVLTISDGEVHDPDEVLQAGTRLNALVSRFQTSINSQAVRLFTSNDQPDTTALCSLLQINNTTTSKLLDISSALSNETLAEKFAELFLSDGFTYRAELKAESKIFKNFPWEHEASDKLSLMSGGNVFWMTKLPKKLSIEGAPLKISVESKLDKEVFYKLLDTKVDFIIDRVKILKVLGTNEANQTVDKIFQYFDKTESCFESSLAQSVNEMLLNSRVQKLLTVRRKKISFLLATIANDDSVSKLNSAQRADYLRQVRSTTSAGRGLARRAAKEGLNFDEVARAEVKAMAENFDKIKDIDDSNHLISFYSQDTTLGGIRALIELSKDENFELLDVNDILEIMNLVGVACKGPIGDFPDPSTWRADEMFLGCNVSLSDVLVAFKQSDGKSLQVPGFNKEITNVIPVFDDPRIGFFLKKHASSLLEYTFSIGMRRMIADVPMTIGYTMSAGILRMIVELNVKHSSLHVDIFKKFVNTFESFVGKYFDHVSLLLKEQDNREMMFYLNNNGISQLMNPLIRIYKTNDQNKLKLVPSILRSLFSFEVWHCIRRLYKNKESSDEIAKATLHELLGIDIEKHKAHVSDLYLEERKFEDINFYSVINLNEVYLKELASNLSNVNYLALIPSYLQAVFNDSNDSFKDIPSLTNEFILKTLEVDSDYKNFLFFNVFQALRFTTRASREDVESEKMKIVDVGNKKEAINEIRSYIRSQFESEYLSDLANKKKLENETMGNEVAAKILRSQKYNKMISVWRDGIVKNGVTYKIENSSSYGFKTFREKLCDPAENVPQRLRIFRIILLGVDNKNAAVWNRGGVCFLNDMKAFKEAFLKFGTWTEWCEIKTKFKGSGKHVYRVQANRHGHSNTKLSFWAMGYSNLIEYKDSVTEEEFKAYCENHSNCCGVRYLGKAVKPTQKSKSTKKTLKKNDPKTNVQLSKQRLK